MTDALDLTLNPGLLSETVTLLERRIGERFPEARLRKVAAQLIPITEKTVERTEFIHRPIFLLRCLVAALWIAVIGSLVMIPVYIRDTGKVSKVTDLIQVVEPALGIAFFVTAFLVFVTSLETRIKRRRALQAMHELRSIAHVIDMMQLTKDPVSVLHPARRTASSPQRTMTPFELSRYLDYCTEMLAVISKIATLYVVNFPDDVAVSAVDDVENLTAGLSRKIWQKIMILDRQASEEASQAPAS